MFGNVKGGFPTEERSIIAIIVAITLEHKMLGKEQELS